MRVPLIPSVCPLQVLVEFSDDPFIASVVKTALTAAREEAAAASAAAEVPGKGSKMKSGKFVGVVDGFKTSLTSLITTLQMGDLHFIRCLKPNDKKAANEWDRPVASRQLLSAGLVSAVSATRSGYTDHLLPHNIIGNFGPLAPDVPTVGKADVETAKAVLEACGITKEQYSVGKTKVFLRQGVLSELQRKRLEHIGQHATLVQCSIRRRLARRMYQKLREEAQRKAEEKRRREEELRRQREEAERRRLEAQRAEEERRRKAEEEEQERRKTVQKARSMSFDRKRRKKQEEEERKVRDEVASKEEAARKRHEEAERKRAEADARMQASLEAAGVSVSERSAAANAAALKERDVGASLIQDLDADPADGADTSSEREAQATMEEMVARAEATAAAAASEASLNLQLPESPETPSGFKLNFPKKGLGGGSSTKGSAAPAPAPGGFQLNLPQALPSALNLSQPVAKKGLIQQRKMDELAKSFVCPLEDVLAYAEMIGMEPNEDTDLLWIADEALQAPEPAGWEVRQDPRGNTYYFNVTTGVTMQQHPVDYHYQQLFLQKKMERTMQNNLAQMTPRSRAAAQAANAKSQQPEKSSTFKLDLRSLSADGDDAPLATPKGWLTKATSMLTPRASKKESEKEAKRELAESLDGLKLVQVEVSVKRGTERLGMELNAYNQILSFVPGGPTDRHPNVLLYDRIAVIDGTELKQRMLTDVLVPREVQQFTLERWVPMDAAANKLPPQVYLSLGKSRHAGMSAEEAARHALEEHATILSKKSKKKSSTLDTSSSLSRFTVTVRRGEHGGLGLVLDEENVVVDMVPGSPVELARQQETKGDPRLQIGDKIMTVDGQVVSTEKPLASVIKPAEAHIMSIERTIEKDLSKGSPTQSRSVFALLSPRGSSKADSPSKQQTPYSRPPSQTIREVRLYKETEDERLGIRFVRDDEGFDRQMWGRDDMVCPIVAALDPKGGAARSGIEIDDMVLSINGQTGLSNTEAASILRDLSGSIIVVLRKCEWLGVKEGETEEEAASYPTPMTPRSAKRELV